MDIRFIPFEEIDQLKWSSCVHYAANGRVFGYYWYLKNLVKEWDGLVEGDYESVFPLIRKGKNRLYQPRWAPQLGLFSVNLISEKRNRAFIEYILDNYKDIDICLNEQQPVLKAHESHYRKIPNWKLNLHQSYADLSAGFDPAFRELAGSHGTKDWHFKTGVKPEAYISFCKESGRKFNIEHLMQRIMYNAMHRGIAALGGIYDEAREPLGMSFWIYSHKRVELIDLYIPSGDQAPTIEGRMLDMIIRTHNGNPLALEFNGLFGNFAEAAGAKEFSFYALQKKSLKGRILRAMGRV